MNSRNTTQTGFSLVELMVAMVLGLILIGTAVTSFQSHSRSGKFVQSVGALQAGARFALDELAAGIRTAGYIGCTAADLGAPKMPTAVGDTALARTHWQPIQGFNVTAGQWLPSMPEDYTAPTAGPGRPVPGSDAIFLEGGVLQGTPLSKRNNVAKKIEITELGFGLEAGAMALISDCSKAEAFHIQSATAGAIAGAQLTSKAELSRVYDVNPVYPRRTQVIPYRKVLYYIADTDRKTRAGTSIRSLYEHLYPFDDHNPVELVASVDTMLIRYRMSSSTGETREVAATHADFDPDSVVGVRIGLLISGSEELDIGTNTPNYRLLGVSIGAANATAGVADHPDDRRVRRVYEGTTMIRNRAEQLNVL